jgi:hypothetical protein
MPVRCSASPEHHLEGKLLRFVVDEKEGGGLCGDHVGRRLDDHLDQPGVRDR